MNLFTSRQNSACFLHSDVLNKLGKTHKFKYTKYLLIRKCVSIRFHLWFDFTVIYKALLFNKLKQW